MRRRFSKIDQSEFQSPVAAMFMTNPYQKNKTCAGNYRDIHCQFGFLFCISQEEI
jgi:hypothetical protein